MSPQEQAVTLIGAIAMLGDLHDELEAKELHGSSDEVARLQSTLSRQLMTLAEEHRLNRVELMRSSTLVGAR